MDDESTPRITLTPITDEQAAALLDAMGAPQSVRDIILGPFNFNLRGGSEE